MTWDEGKTARENAINNNKGVFSRIISALHRNRLGELLVIRGVISPEQLKEALGLQRSLNMPLGQVLVEQRVVSRSQLRYTLGRQFMLRCTATAILGFVTLVGFAQKKARADLPDTPAKIALSVSDHFTQVSYYPGLFGSEEERSTNLKPFTKWTGMFDRFERDLQRSSSKATLANWVNKLEKFKGLPLKSMADKVNRMVNEVRYINDSKNWGQSDYWATPVQFLERGGDCEDFAITKYTALRALGVPEERLRVAIVHDNVKNIPHAVLVVYTDEGTVILDNQNKGLVDGEKMQRYRPIFSINRTAWWLHTAPSKTILASAQ
ncbi:MAG: transglutaminase-like cysteine peptidase [Alphaproteobacteria bacterium]|nr:transglutaminase-like cysteine peptidase [Alphaproteobacteria bacterium]MCD8520318.1 transglutaminase-like cysteine peptidase [Alphaproteobacteria bacterium]MCD8526378.1 transglutaminase-like cysteine peptidase [Alphaproteobacteria bacterium]MCD8571586.1 transglutaminase-like cysteine peptidase [Alphaproteobacteria bacterium]